jgi:hypothetical protein
MFVVGNGYRLLVLRIAFWGGGCGSVLVVRLVMVPDILLGPEETSTGCPSLLWGWLGFGSSGPVGPLFTKLPWSTVVGLGVWWRCGVAGWPLFENCTVDASIFVVKLPRANGECLGTRSR